MTLPVLVVTGFLGAGKTTFINRLLAGAEGLRIAAVVNDFGAINIDAALIADRSDTVIGLSNGCICCSLQGDLLRTLKILTGRPDPIDHVVIEASGVADPQGIVQALSDPVLWPAVRLNAVLTVVDAADCLADPARMADPVWQAQVAGADLIHLSRTAGLDPAPLVPRLVAGGARLLPPGDPAPALVLDPLPDRLRPGRAVVTDDRFVAVEIEDARPLRMADFRAAIESLAPVLSRAKGFVTLTGRPGAMLFQMVGRRATLEPGEGAAEGCRLVLIGERGAFDPEAARALILAAFEGQDGAPIRRN